VAVTRSEEEDGPLTTLLRDLGARVLPWGTVTFAPPEDETPFLKALARIAQYDWICFASPRAVDAVVTRVTYPSSDDEGGTVPGSTQEPFPRVAAVGPITAKALQGAGWPVHRVPEEGGGEALVDGFRAAGDTAGRRVLLPASSRARDDIPLGLSSLGASVERVTAYRLVALPLEPDRCRAELDRGEVQVITFASPSALEGLRKGVGAALFERFSKEIPAAAIGPTTHTAVREAGWRYVAVAERTDLAGLARAAVEAARSHETESSG
jgi:uroporphyrinogen-III synthase